ncbi:MAG: hypothetical protein WA840_12785 [Caulobacteraceae bacterium]
MAAQLTQNLQTQSGNNVVVMMGGVQVGLMQNVRASDDYGLEPASGIGDIHVVEYVPGMAKHSLTVSAMVLRKGSLRAAGVAAENGDAVLQGLVFDFLVMDKTTGQLLRKYTGCSYHSGDVEVNKHAIVMNHAQFNALDASGVGI